jgi:hypothetical protein
LILLGVAPKEVAQQTCTGISERRFRQQVDPMDRRTIVRNFSRPDDSPNVF